MTDKPCLHCKIRALINEHEYDRGGPDALDFLLEVIGDYINCADEPTRDMLYRRLAVRIRSDMADIRAGTYKSWPSVARH